MRILAGFLTLVLLGAGVFWALTRPAPLDPDFAAGHTPNAAAGERIFYAAGCSSCHAAPESDNKMVLAGGQAFVSEFGVFYAPNISPGPEGLGGWDLPTFARAVTGGVSPGGAHYYPAFPYASYMHMRDEDVSDLHAFMTGLPVSDTPSLQHEISFPYNIRRGLGLWKAKYMKEDFVLAGDLSDVEMRGRYLVEALGHCGECHTPRDRVGGLRRDEWLTGAPNPSGEGRIPDITPGGLDWSQTDIAYYLESGLTPDYDSVGGSMAAVVENLSKLPESDRMAIAAYLKALP